MAKKKQIQEVPLSIKDCAIISRMDDAESILGLQPPFEPSNTNRKIEEFLANAPFVQDEEELYGQAAAFGSFWGCLLVSCLDWEWIAIEYDDWRGLGVADKERRHIILPVNLFYKLLTNANVPGPTLRFNAIREGYLPVSEPNQYLILE